MFPRRQMGSSISPATVTIPELEQAKTAVLNTRKCERALAVRFTEPPVACAFDNTFTIR
jgi:hypothetical protein